MEEPPIVVAVPQDVLANVSLSLQPEGAEDSNSSEPSVAAATISTPPAQLASDTSETQLGTVNSRVAMPQTNLVFSNAETVIVTEDVVKLGITAIEFSNTGSLSLQTTGNEPPSTSTIVIHTVEEPPSNEVHSGVIGSSSKHVNVSEERAVTSTYVHTETKGSTLPGIDTVISGNKACI